MAHSSWKIMSLRGLQQRGNLTSSKIKDEKLRKKGASP